MINLLSGLIFADASRPLEPSTRERMAWGGASGSTDCAVTDSGALFQSVGANSWSERQGDAIIAADLDVSNLDAILAATGCTSAGAALRILYRQDSTGFPNRLRGAFAIALWFPAQRRLVLAIDRFGFRRLYYATTASGIAFSSRLQGVFTLPDLPRDGDPDAAYAYMNFGTVPAPQSMYRGVQRLLPGHVLQWHDGSVSIEPYWNVRYTEVPRARRAAAAELVGRTEDAVRHALTGSDLKHTGSFLSGGTDSSTVVGLMTRLTGERIHAFSIGFREPRYNELHYAEGAARQFGASHYTQIVTADEAFTSLPDLVAAYDEPFGNNSAIATYLCAHLARQAGMRVMLAGDGGDEIFGGNDRYRREQVLARYGRIPRPLRRLLEPALRTWPLSEAALIGKARRYVQRASLPNPDRFYSSEFFVAQERAWLLAPEFRAATTPTWPWDIARHHYHAAPASAELNRLLYVDVKITLGDNDLLKVTRAAELAGIGVRFPLLDHPLVEFTATLPVRDKVRGTEKRYLFKRAFASLLPAEVLAKAKHGFGLPISGWLKTHAPFRDLAR
ncbi:MAG: asparagine synthetase B family protein, partial [Dehalococcoidia bacterium]